MIEPPDQWRLVLSATAGRLPRTHVLRAGPTRKAAEKPTRFVEKFPVSAAVQGRLDWRALPRAHWQSRIDRWDLLRAPSQSPAPPTAERHASSMRCGAAAP